MSARYRSEIASLRARAGGLSGFDRMFHLPPQGAGVPDATIIGWLTALGNELKDNAGAAGDHPSLAAGYTYLGQFIDHDVTLDPTSLPMTAIDVRALTNFRSPALDLDSLLGFGPAVDAHLYEAGAGPRAGHLRTAESLAGNPLATAHDLPRFRDGAPIIGDPRNDENLLVGQLHTAFITFYNKILDDLTAGLIPDLGPAGATTVERAARIARWHYQWIVLHDFLPRFIDHTILTHTIAAGPFHYYPNPAMPYMPVEFAGAAYRLGHSMVREIYHVNANFKTATLRELFVFSSSGGSVPVPSNWFINWNRLFEIDPATEVNLARRFDPYIAPTLHALPGVPAPNSLAVRNLIRGWAWGLPSGQAVAAHLGVPVLTSAEILNDPAGAPYQEAAVVQGFGLDVDSPLWYYILKEAQVRNEGRFLGPVGSTIVAEVFVGLLRADAESYLSVDSAWTPTLPSAAVGQFTMADLFRYLPADALDPVGGDAGPL